MHSLNSSKNWSMKWSVLSNKIQLSRDVAGQHEVIFKIIKKTNKKVKVCHSLNHSFIKRISLKHKGKGQNVNSVVLHYQFLSDY